VNTQKQLAEIARLINEYGPHHPIVQEYIEKIGDEEAQELAQLSVDLASVFRKEFPLDG
jgi:hypothetical protein